MIRIFEFFVNSGLGIPSDNNPGLSGMDWYLDLHGDDKRRGAWQDVTETADRHNQPGEFTAFIGWEWTALPGGANLHRVIFTPAGSETANRFLPFSGTESPRPEDLWEWLASIEERTGAEFIAIPHNSNVSMGRMFPLEDSFQNPLSKPYARRRMQFERVVEVTQIKGDSEAHPALSPTDEFADFETYNALLYPNGPTPDATRGDYVRSGLVRGLEIENKHRRESLSIWIDRFDRLPYGDVGDRGDRFRGQGAEGLVASTSFETDWDRCREGLGHGGGGARCRVGCRKHAGLDLRCVHAERSLRDDGDEGHAEGESRLGLSLS